jgi:nicotinamidase-related amidase
MTTETIEPIDPATTALLVLDYQTGILERLDDPARLPARANAAIDWLRARGGTIGFVRVAFADGELPGGTMGRRVTPEMARTALHADAPTTQLHPDLDHRDGDVVVRKTRVGPFARTELDDQLRAAGIDTLLIAGVATSGAVLSAVRDAHDRDYRVIVLCDLCADTEPEVHDFLVERILSRQADVLDSSELGRLAA